MNNRQLASLLRPLVAQAFEISEHAFAGRRRWGGAVTPRHAFWAILNLEAGMPLAEIARIEDREHSTILHGCHRHTERIMTDPQVRHRAEVAKVRWLRALSEQGFDLETRRHRIVNRRPVAPTIERDLIVIEALTVLRDPPAQVARVLRVPAREIRRVARRFDLQLTQRKARETPRKSALIK